MILMALAFRRPHVPRLCDDAALKAECCVLLR